MQQTNKILLAVSVFAVAVALGLGTLSSAQAYRGDPAVKGPNYSAERHAAMEAAFENKDYAAWKELMQGRGRATSIITRENFAKFTEAHELAEDGKYAEADAIRKELGLPTRDEMQSRGGFGQGSGGHRGNCNR